MKPTPKHIVTVCEACGEPWELHGDDPTEADCIRLLRDHVARAEAGRITINPALPYTPNVQPWPLGQTWISAPDTRTVTASHTGNVRALNSGDGVRWRNAANSGDQGWTTQGDDEEPPEPVGVPA